MTSTRLLLIAATTTVATTASAFAQSQASQTANQVANQAASQATQQTQQAQQSATTVPPIPAGDPTNRVPTRPPTPTETANEIAARMFNSGGSLMQAQLDVNSAFPQVADPAVASPYSFFSVPEPEPTVIAKQDLVTVIIREESSSKSSSKTETDKSYGFEAVLDEYIRLNGIDLDSRVAGDRMAFDMNHGFSGDGSFDRKDSVVTRFSVTVIDVKPNGNLVLAGEREIITDDEVQTFRMTGTARTQDITPDNTVLSTQLADLKFEKHTEGAVSESSKRGFIPRIIDKVNPF